MCVVLYKEKGMCVFMGTKNGNANKKEKGISVSVANSGGAVRKKVKRKAQKKKSKRKTPVRLLKENSGLTIEETVFVKKFIEQGFRRQTAAYLGAFKGCTYGSAAVSAHALLKNPKVIEAIDEAKLKLYEGLDISARRNIVQLQNLAFNDIRNFFNMDGSLKKFSELDIMQQACIHSLEVEELWLGRGEARTQIGVVKKVRFYDRIRALEVLGKYLAKEDGESGAFNGGNNNVNLNFQQNNIQLDLNALLEKAEALGVESASVGRIRELMSEPQPVDQKGKV